MLARKYIPQNISLSLVLLIFLVLFLNGWSSGLLSGALVLIMGGLEPEGVGSSWCRVDLLGTRPRWSPRQKREGLLLLLEVTKSSPGSNHEAWPLYLV